ncbi:Uncharacterised protein [uncultured archaeon]|nr:Uncharacterised protein [uncultured archaeon]
MEEKKIQKAEPDRLDKIIPEWARILKNKLNEDSSQNDKKTC